MILDAAPSFNWATKDQRQAICNGCGSKGFGLIIPDTLWGLSITMACNIHDWDYLHGVTIEDKQKADRRFLNNCLRLIEDQSSFMGKILKPLRRRRALKYYEAVTLLGGPAFWNGKEDA